MNLFQRDWTGAAVDVARGVTNAIFLRVLSQETAKIRRVGVLLKEQKSLSGRMEELKGQAGKDDPRLKILKDKEADIIKRLRPDTSLITVGPDKSERHLHEQLIVNEQVHLLKDHDAPVTDEHVKELVKFRLSDEGDKTCKAIAVPTREGPYILNQIFCIVAEAEEQNNQLDIRTFPSNADVIKDTPSKSLTGYENLVGYWTISAAIPKTGGWMVSDVSADAPDGFVQTTISPIRKFIEPHDKVGSRQQLLDQDEDTIRLMALDYLIKQRDPVKGFHVNGNGAFIGNISINPDSDLDPLIVNYIYDLPGAVVHKARAKAGNTPLSPMLYHMLGDSVSGAYNVSQSHFVSRPAFRNL